MTEVFVTARAETDMANMALFLAERDPASALRFYDAVAEAVARIAVFPFIGRQLAGG